MTDSILKNSAIFKSFDNLTIVMVSFKNLLTFYESGIKNKKKSEKEISPQKINIQEDKTKSNDWVRSSINNNPSNVVSSSKHH